MPNDPLVAEYYYNFELVKSSLNTVGWSCNSKFCDTLWSTNIVNEISMTTDCPNKLFKESIKNLNMLSKIKK